MNSETTKAKTTGDTATQSPKTRARSADDRKAEAALEATIAKLEKQYGPGTVMRLGDGAKQAVEATSTGSPALDLATGCGGYPRGRVVEIYGPESSGKTTLTLHAIAACQAAGGCAAFIDAEHALDPTYAANLGVQLDELLVSQPDYGEQGLEVAEQLVSSGAVDLIVIDSVAALVPRVELEGEMEDVQVGLQARMMSKALRKLTAVANKNGTTIIFINQLRQKIGVTFGSGETTTGGNALKFYASLRLDVRRIGAIRVGTDAVGNKTRVKVVKNKLAPPFREVEFEILYGRGISVEGELIDQGLALDVIDRSGSWFCLGEERLANGRENLRQRLQDEPELAGRLAQGIRSAATAPAAPAAA